MNISFVIDEKEPSIYTIEGTTSEQPYDNIVIMLRRTQKKKERTKKEGRI